MEARLTVTTANDCETRIILESLPGVRILSAVRIMLTGKTRFTVSARTRGNVDAIRKSVLSGTDVSWE